MINLWEIEAKLVFEQNIASLLPFVPILKGGGNEATVTNALVELRKNEKLEDLEPLLSFFASFVLAIPIVQKIMRWDMTILRESPWYQTILQEGLLKGEEQGLQQGLQQGLKQGLKQGELELVNRLIKKRFGEVTDNIKFELQSLSVQKLELLAENLFDFNSLDDVTQWLNDNQS